jgi:hypothetical protein
MRKYKIRVTKEGRTILFSPLSKRKNNVVGDYLDDIYEDGNKNNSIYEIWRKAGWVELEPITGLRSIDDPWEPSRE